MSLLDSVWRRRLKGLTRQQIVKQLPKLGYKVRQKIAFDYQFNALPHQLLPSDYWRFCLNKAGRGSGKTWTGSKWVIDRAEKYPKEIIGLFGQTADDVRTTMIEVGPSSILKLSSPDFYPKWESSKRQLTWPNGAVAKIYYGDEPSQARGPNFGSVWVDEWCKFRYPGPCLDMIDFALRDCADPRCLITTTPKPIQELKDLIKDPDAVVMTASSYDNTKLKGTKFFERLQSAYEGTILGRQEIHAEVIDDIPGALWRYSMFNYILPSELPDLQNIVIAIDPAVTVSESADETGIIIAGRAGDNFYVTHDISGKHTTTEWAHQAIHNYDRLSADEIIGESNNGGDLVESNIRLNATLLCKEGVRTTEYINVDQVKASRGKELRAQPISSLYKSGRVYHVGRFATLEQQCCSWIPGDKTIKWSPDRMDALVYVLTRLIEASGQPLPGGFFM